MYDNAIWHLQTHVTVCIVSVPISRWLFLYVPSEPWATKASLKAHVLLGYLFL